MKDHELIESVGNWKKLVAKYQKANSLKAVQQIITSFGPFIACWILMYFSLDYSILLTLALGMLNAFFVVRIFIIQHDCGHFSFFKNRKINKAIGWICSLFSSIPFDYWARVHSFHHGHTGQLEYRDIGDINFKTVEEYRAMNRLQRIQYRIFRHPLVIFVVVPTLYLAVVQRVSRVSFPGWSKVHLKQHLNNLVLLAVYIALGFLIGWKAFLIIQGSTLFFFGIIAFWFFYVQHQHEETYMQWSNNWDYMMAALKGSTYYKLPRILHWLTGNIGYHHLHHLSSRIPSYNLPKCAKENPIFQKYVTTISFFNSLPMMFNKLWDEQSQRMITMREFYRMEAALA